MGSRTKANPTPELAAQVVSLYATGLPVWRVAEKVGRSTDWTYLVLEQQGVPRRKWRGGSTGWRKPEIGYSGAHRRVYRTRGLPQECEVCGTAEKRKYEWANLTGDYENVEDYKRMCTSCHRRFDNERRRTSEQA